MNCAYHIHNSAVVNCNGCGKPLCPACDHRVKGFPYCQDCIVSGVELLRQHNQKSYTSYVKKETSPLVATILSFVCPGLGAAYNGQTAKAMVHFAVFAGLFQMAILTGGMAIFVLGFLGMWLFAALDALRTARSIRAGITPDDAEDLLVQRFSGNPKLWGIVLTALGISFFAQAFFNFRFLSRFILPLLLIGLGIYLIRNYIFTTKEKSGERPKFADPQYKSSFIAEEEIDFAGETRARAWKNR